MTLRSVELFTAYEPGAWLPLVSPTPLLMVVALGDHLTVVAGAGRVRAGTQPKRLVCLPGGHFDAYVDGFAAASAPARIGSPSISWAAERCSSGLRRRRIRVSGVAPRRYHGAGWPGGS